MTSSYNIRNCLLFMQKCLGIYSSELVYYGTSRVSMIKMLKYGTPIEPAFEVKTTAMTSHSETKAYLGPYQISMMEPFNLFCKIASLK